MEPIMLSPFVARGQRPGRRALPDSVQTHGAYVDYSV